MDEAFGRLYNFDFDRADEILDARLAARPEDYFAHGVRASSLLFRELHRLAILESEFFADDERIRDRRRLSCRRRA